MAAAVVTDAVLRVARGIEQEPRQNLQFVSCAHRMGLFAFLSGELSLGASSHFASCGTIKRAMHECVAGRVDSIRVKNSFNV